MRTLLFWHNTFHNRKRCAAATAGITFAVLLIFIQVGFLDAARINAVLLYESMDFDALIVSRGYVSAQRTLPMNPFRVLQAGKVSGVEAAIPLLVENARWHNLEARKSRSCQVIGVDPSLPPFWDAGLLALTTRIRTPNTLLVDRLSSRKYGEWEEGGSISLNDRQYTVAGSYTMGTGLISDGGVIVSFETFQAINGRGRDQGHDMGLLRFGPGADPAAVMEAVRAVLPADVMVLSRREIIEREQHFWVNLKPVGIMFKVGAIVAFIIGSVILYQVLALEISNRMNEFATLKAMGYGPGYLYQVGAGQALIYTVMSYIPAFLLASGLYRVVFDLSRLPLHMDAGRAGLVLLLTLSMCAIGAMLALRRMRRADPADLF
jgi:putative ABC transport system permease protein